MANLYDMIVGSESGKGGYSTLYSHAQRPGGAFAGTDVSKMTLGEINDFSTGPYAKWSKDKLGYTATPMGAFQIVGQTSRGLQDQLGLPDDTVFSPEVQNQMAMELIRQTGGDPARLKSTWEGLRNYSDDELVQAYAQMTGGGGADFLAGGVGGGGGGGGGGGAGGGGGFAAGPGRQFPDLPPRVVGGGGDTMVGGTAAGLAYDGDQAKKAVDNLVGNDRTTSIGPWQAPEREKYERSTEDMIGAALMGMGNAIGGGSAGDSIAIAQNALSGVEDDFLAEQDRRERDSRQLWEDELALDDRGYNRGRTDRKDRREARLDAETAARLAEEDDRSAWRWARELLGADTADRVATAEAKKKAADPYSHLPQKTQDYLRILGIEGMDEQTAKELAFGKFAPKQDAALPGLE